MYRVGAGRKKRCLSLAQGLRNEMKALLR
jgi:hypothetical protein